MRNVEKQLWERMNVGQRSRDKKRGRLKGRGDNWEDEKSERARKRHWNKDTIANII